MASSSCYQADEEHAWHDPLDLPLRVCVCVACACVYPVCVSGGIVLCNLHMVILGYWATVMPSHNVGQMDWCPILFLTHHHMHAHVQKPRAFKTKKSSISRNCDTLTYAKHIDYIELLAGML